MQIVSKGDNLLEMPKPIFWEKVKKKYIFKLLSAEILPRMLSVCFYQGLQSEENTCSLSSL